MKLSKPIQSKTVNLFCATSLGVIEFELYSGAAPVSCEIFMESVLAGYYDGGEFFRAVREGNDSGSPKIDVIQASAKPGKPEFSVAHEGTETTGLRHLAGTMSLPRSEVGTATTAGFFVCVTDSPSLDFGGHRNPDGLGFAAFGRIAEGIDIVREIHGFPCCESGEDLSMRGQMLSNPVEILSFGRVPPSSLFRQ